MTLYRNSRTTLSLLSIIALGVAHLQLAATPITFSASSGELAASVTFDTVGNSLVVRLSNTSTYDVMVQNQILTAVFFDIAGAQLNLSPGLGSALLAPGSSVLFDTLDSNGNPITDILGGEWAYRGGISALTQFGQNYGISSSGFNIFGSANFPGPDLDSPLAVNGVNYGLTSAGDNILTGQMAVTGTRPLVQSSVIFTIPGLPDGFDPSTSITHISWQYGTSLNSVSADSPALLAAPIPEPTTTALLVVGGALAWVTRMRRNLAKQTFREDEAQTCRRNLRNPDQPSTL